MVRMDLRSLGSSSPPNPNLPSGPGTSEMSPRTLVISLQSVRPDLLASLYSSLCSEVCTLIMAL